MKAANQTRARPGNPSMQTARWLDVYCSSIDDLEAAVLRVAIGTAGAVIEPKNSSYLIVVKTGSATPERLSILTKGGSSFLIELQVGDMFVADVGSTVTVRSAGESIMLYQLADQSLRRFARHRGLAGIDSLHCNVVQSDPVLQHLSRAARLLLEENSRAVEPIGDALVRSFYSHVLDCYGRKGFSYGEGRDRLSSRHKRLIEQEFEASFGRKMSLGLLAVRCELTPEKLSRAFRNTYGQSFNRYLMGIRIRRAKELLRSTGLTLPTIAHRIGYANQATFTESFTKMVGTPPGRFRRSLVGTQSTVRAAGV